MNGEGSSPSPSTIPKYKGDGNMDITIPLLKAEDIECRVQSVSQQQGKQPGVILLLYKDARVDMRILDQVFGPLNWQRTHEVVNGNLFCSIDIWDADKNTWVRKQDVGVESNTEKEKGQASDSFKRAGTNVGIGRELYSAPFIYVTLLPNEYTTVQGQRGGIKCNSSTKFSVSHISYNDRREISELKITDSDGNTRYTFPRNKSYQKPPDNTGGNSNNIKSTTDNKNAASATKATGTEAKPKTKTANDMKINDKLEGVILSLARKAGYTEERMAKMVKAKYKKEIKDLTLGEYNLICPALEKQAEQRAQGLIDDMEPMFK